MKDCNCKNNTPSIVLKDTEDKALSLNYTIGKLMLKLVIYMCFLVFLPFICLYIAWFVFDMIVLNKNLDIKPLLLSVANRLGGNTKIKIQDETIAPEDLVMMDVEDITNHPMSK